MKNNKKIIILSLVLVMGLTMAISYVFWARALRTDAEDNLTVTIGSGNEVETRIRLDGDMPGGILVPHDIDPVAGETDAITFEIGVFWEGIGPGAGNIAELVGDLEIEQTALMIGGDATDAGLFNVTIDPSNTEITANDEVAQTIVVTVTMNRPANEAQHERVAGEDLDITLTFSVEPQTP